MEMQFWWILEGQELLLLLCIFFPTQSLQNLAFLMSKNIKFPFHKTIKLVSNCGFNNQDFDWNVMPEGGMPGLWLLPESLEKLRLTLETSKGPLEKWPGTLFGHVVRGSLSR